MIFLDGQVATYNMYNQPVNERNGRPITLTAGSVHSIVVAYYQVCSFVLVAHLLVLFFVCLFFVLPFLSLYLLLIYFSREQANGGYQMAARVLLPGHTKLQYIDNTMLIQGTCESWICYRVDLLSFALICSCS